MIRTVKVSVTRAANCKFVGTNLPSLLLDVLAQFRGLLGTTIHCNGSKWTSATEYLFEFIVCWQIKFH